MAKVPILKMRQELALQTRLARDIVNEINRSEPWAGMQKAVDDLVKQHPNTKPRTLTASLQYNCFGLTFASRRANITSDQIGMICADDDYQEVPKNDVMRGDIALYKSKTSGEFEHSGIAVSECQGLGGPWVVSKWGDLHEVLHLLYDCPYSNSEVTFFRIRT